MPFYTAWEYEPWSLTGFWQIERDAAGLFALLKGGYIQWYNESFLWLTSVTYARSSFSDLLFIMAQCSKDRCAT